MIITYLGHSGFLAELEDVYFLFDYYKGEIPKLQKEKPLIVFVSHRHHDHYNRKIWDLRKEYPHVRYVISKDISMSERMRQRFSITEEDLKNILRAAPDQIYEMDIWGKTALKIETFRSTDEGTAFYLTCGKHTLYHAGDLHLWLWQEEGEEWNRDMRNRFFRELEKLRGRHVEAAFLPLDKRQENYAYAGMDAYQEAMDADYVFPMHCWEDYGIIDAYREARKDRPYISSIVRIEKDGQRFELP